MSSSISGKPSLVYIILIASAAALGGFLFGFDTAVINGTIPALKSTFHATDVQIGASVSLALIGAAIGAYFAGSIADRLGRVRCMLIASILFLISAIGSGLPFGIPDFIMWRVIGGVGVGVASIIAPAYIAETAPAHLRGRLGSLQQLAIVIGIFAALLSNYAIVAIAEHLSVNAELVRLNASDPNAFKAAGSFAAGNFFLGFKAWQWMFWIEAIPALLYGIAALLLPESPRYLVAKEKEREAAKILMKLIADDIGEKINAIKETIKVDAPARLSDLLEVTKNARKRLAPIVWVGLGLAVLQQLVGINVIFYYGNVLWQSVGFNESDSLMLNVLSSVVNIATTLIAIALIDKLGRKPLLLIGSSGMFFSLLLLTVIFATAGTDANGNPLLSGISAYIAVAAANLFIIFFGMSWGPIMWVMLGEMFNNRIRAMALAVCGLAQWLANFFVSFTFPVFTSNVGLGGAYGFYTLFAFISIFFVVRFIRETKNKELESM
ncbi:MAG: MFS transporter [Fibrobacter sp.]|jgi:MFS family permease|nr:MFS transporter [Fibrobacter sp.]